MKYFTLATFFFSAIILATASPLPDIENMSEVKGELTNSVAKSNDEPLSREVIRERREGNDDDIYAFAYEGDYSDVIKNFDPLQKEVNRERREVDYYNEPLSREVNRETPASEVKREQRDVAVAGKGYGHYNKGGRRGHGKHGHRYG